MMNKKIFFLAGSCFFAVIVILSLSYFFYQKKQPWHFSYFVRHFADNEEIEISDDDRPVFETDDEFELLAINGWLDYFFIVLLFLAVDRFFGKVKDNDFFLALIWQVGQFLNIAKIDFDAQQVNKAFQEVAAEKIKKFYEWKEASQFDFKAEFEKSNKEIEQFQKKFPQAYNNIHTNLFVCKYLQQGCFCVSNDVCQKLWLSWPYFDLLRRLCFVIFVLVFLIITVFVFNLYFILKNGYLIGFRMTMYNFTWSDFFSIYQIFCHKSRFEKLFLSIVFLGLRIFIYWRFSKSCFSELLLYANKVFNIEMINKFPNTPLQTEQGYKLEMAQYLQDQK